MEQEEMINEMLTAKDMLDFQMWKEFEAEYRLNKHGGLQLLRILLDRALGVKENEKMKKVNDEFINAYVIRMK